MIHEIPLKPKLETLQESIGYFFKDITLLETALCHRSLSKTISNERLEFLGDRILGLVIAEYLYLNFPDDEGKLAKKINFLVCKQTCADAAKKIDLGRFLMLAQSEEEGGGRKRNALLGDACEALIAAVYLDSNFDTARILILSLWTEALETPIKMIDAKSELQEWAQGLKLGLPEYTILAKEGLDHNPLFTIKVTVNGYGDATAQGTSRRLAESEAALVFLKTFAHDILE
jgi:ribonuclease III